MKSECGVVVTSVSAGLPAAKAGIRDGDIITDIDGSPVTGSASLLDIIGNTAVGKTVRIKINRDGREMTIPVTVADRSEVVQANNDAPDPDRNTSGDAGPARLGIRIQDVTADMLRQLRLPSQDGVYVSAVEPGSAADDAGITRGTIITRIIAGNNQRFDVRNVDDFQRIERSLKPGQEIALMVLQQQRGGQYRSGYLPLTIP
jgi:serine protease Do